MFTWTLLNMAIRVCRAGWTQTKTQHQEKMLFLSHSSMSFFDFFLFCKWNGSRRTERTLPYSVEGNAEILHRAPTRYHHPLSFTDEHHLMFFLKRHEWHFIIWIYHNSNWHRAAANRSTENNTSQQCGNKSNSEHNLIYPKGCPSQHHIKTW